MIDLALGGGKGIYLFIESFFDLKKMMRISVIYLIVLIRIKYCNYLSESLFLSAK